MIYLEAFVRLIFLHFLLHYLLQVAFISGNYDIIQQPKDISKTAKENIPFYMFIDEETEAFLKNSSVLGSRKRVGIWRIIVVRNIPYTDARRNGKVSLFLCFNFLLVVSTQFVLMQKGVILST